MVTGLRLLGFVLAWCVLLLVACENPLPGRAVDGADPGALEPDAFGSPRLSFDPPSTADAVAPVVRVAIDFGGPLSNPLVVLVTGVLSASQVRDLARPVVPQTITARAVPAIAWMGERAGELWVAPLAALEPGALYTVGISAPPSAFPFSVVAAGAVPVIERIWPPREDTAPAAPVAVWCAPRPLPFSGALATLPPGGIAGRLASGTGGAIHAPSCLHWAFAASDIDPSAGALGVAPPSVLLDTGERIALGPVSLRAGSVGARATAAICTASEIPFGLGCVSVGDDRIAVRSPDEAVLWTIDTGADVIVRATHGGSRFVIRALPGATTIYRVAALDRSGLTRVEEVAITPAAERPHVVLNEVLANPAGSEPAQEWVELYNDGPRPELLEGYTIEDDGGRAALPSFQLEPGAFALVVSEGYVADDGVDPVAAPGTVVVRVPSLSRGGLSNEGERLVLRDAAGAPLSVFPAIKQKNGQSAARTVPDAPDDDPGSFVPSVNGASTPGSPNAP